MLSGVDGDKKNLIMVGESIFPERISLWVANAQRSKLNSSKVRKQCRRQVEIILAELAEGCSKAVGHH